MFKFNALTLALGLSAAAVLNPAQAAGSASDAGAIPHLDHVMVVMMENHAFNQVIGNANTPFINTYAKQANLARNYFGVGHPSLTNYLEVVGGSNFGIQNDNDPDWNNAGCVPALVTGKPQLEKAPKICPIAGEGMDAPTPEVDTSNEGTPAAPIHNIPVAAAHAVGKTIADQLVDAGKTWKTYQENLPPAGAAGVNWSDGLLTNATPGSSSGIPRLYAVKHNPFAYFAAVQQGTIPGLSLHNMQGFDALYADLRAGSLPTFALIAPNQCHDQHGRGAAEVGPGCSTDAGMMSHGDATVRQLVEAVKASPMWSQGHNALIIVWDENDYGTGPNQVVATVDTNYGVHGVASDVHYNHFSLLKSIEAGLGLPYLNHAADKDVQLMTDLFASR